MAIDTDPAKLAGLPCEAVHGNVEYLAVLEEAGLALAKRLVAALALGIARWLRVPPLPLLLCGGLALSALGLAPAADSLDDAIELGLAFLVFAAAATRIEQLGGTAILNSQAAADTFMEWFEKWRA